VQWPPRIVQGVAHQRGRPSKACSDLPTRRSSVTTFIQIIPQRPDVRWTPRRPSGLLDRGGWTIRTTLDPPDPETSRRVGQIGDTPRDPRRRSPHKPSWIEPGNRATSRDGATRCGGHQHRSAGERYTTWSTEVQRQGLRPSRPGRRFKDFTMAAALAKKVARQHQDKTPRRHKSSRIQEMHTTVSNTRRNPPRNSPAPADAHGQARASRSTPTSWRSRRRSAVRAPLSTLSGHQGREGKGRSPTPVLVDAEALETTPMDMSERTPLRSARRHCTSSASSRSATAAARERGWAA